MEMIKNKWLWGLILLLTFVGGLVHLLQPLGFNLLTWLSTMIGSAATNVIQFLAGVATIIVVAKVMKWMK